MKREVFIERAKAIHGDKYDYSLVVDATQKEKVNIICPIHGKFSQAVGGHLEGRGCKLCGRAKASESRKISPDEFIDRVSKLYGNEIDFSKTKYTSCYDKVTATCRKHGDFSVAPSVLLSRRGCPRCGEERTANAHRKTADVFIEKCKQVHGDLYDYSKTEYLECKKDVEIICKKHGSFWQSPSNHERGAGCPKCYRERQGDSSRMSYEQFKEKATEVHSGNYTYPDQEYKNTSEEIVIVCKKHGEFLQTPKTHLRGAGCPKCNSSRGEIFTRRWLNYNKIEFEEQKRFSECKLKQMLPFDFYLEALNTCIEFQGIQHFKVTSFDKGKTHTNLELQQRRDNIKRNYCKDNGINLVEIRYDDDIYKVLDEKIGVLL